MLKHPMIPQTSRSDPTKPLPDVGTIDSSLVVLMQEGTDPGSQLTPKKVLSFRCFPATIKHVQDPESQLFNSYQEALDHLKQAYPAPPRLTCVLDSVRADWALGNRTHATFRVFPFPVVPTRVSIQEAKELITRHGTLAFKYRLESEEGPLPYDIYELKNRAPGGFYLYGISRHWASRRKKLSDLAARRDREAGIFSSHLFTTPGISRIYLPTGRRVILRELDACHSKTRAERSRTCGLVVHDFLSVVLLFLGDLSKEVPSIINEVFLCRHQRSVIHEFLNDLLPIWPFLVYHSEARKDTPTQFIEFQATISRLIRTTRYRGFRVEKSLTAQPLSERTSS